MATILPVVRIIPSSPEESSFNCTTVSTSEIPGKGTPSSEAPLRPMSHRPHFPGLFIAFFTAFRRLSFLILSYTLLLLPVLAVVVLFISGISSSSSITTFLLLFLSIRILIVASITSIVSLVAVAVLALLLFLLF
jgi:hypothetical protein